MAYSEEEQHRRDIDWFFTDSSNRIFHVASGGGILPKRIQENDQINRELGRFFRNLPFIFNAELNQNVFSIIGYQNETELNRNLYSEDFLSFAKKGIFSLDNSKIGDFENKFYHFVAKPSRGFLNYMELNRSFEIPKLNTTIDVQELGKFNLIDLIS
jgi:hypothetical protein